MSLSTTPQSHSQPDHLDTSPLFSSQHTLSEPSYQSLPSSDSTQHAGSSLYSLPHDSDSIHPPPLPSSNGFHHTYSSPEDFRLTPPKEVTSPLSSPSFHPSPTTPPPSQPHAIQPRSPTTASSAFSFTSTDSQPGSLREESQFPSSFPPLSSSPLPSSLHGDGHPHDSPSNGFKPSSSPFHRSPAPLRAASRESMYSHSNGDVHHNMYTADNPLHQLASVTPLILAPSFLPYQSSSSSCHSLLSYSHPHQRQDSDSIFHSHTHSNGHPQHTALKSNGDDPMNVHIEEEEEEVEFSHCVPAHRTPRQQRHITVKSETEQYRHTDEFCYEPVPALLPASPLPRHHCDPFVNGNGILHFPSSSPFAPPTLPVRHAERRELNGHGEERKRGGKRGRVIKSEPNVIRTSTARMLNGIPVHLASIVDPPSSNGHSSRPKKPAIASNGEAVNEVFASPTELSVSPLIFDNRPTHNSNKPKRFFCQECGKGFTQKGGLLNHERIHRGERPYSCVYPGCTRSFVQKCNLTRHERVHSGEKPYQCPVLQCGKQFNRKHGLAQHLATAHQMVTGSSEASEDSAASGSENFKVEEYENESEIEEGRGMVNALWFSNIPLLPYCGGEELRGGENMREGEEAGMDEKGGEERGRNTRRRRTE